MRRTADCVILIDLELEIVSIIHSMIERGGQSIIPDHSQNSAPTELRIPSRRPYWNVAGHLFSSVLALALSQSRSAPPHSCLCEPELRAPKFSYSEPHSAPQHSWHCEQPRITQTQSLFSSSTLLPLRTTKSTSV